MDLLASAYDSDDDGVVQQPAIVPTSAPKASSSSASSTKTPSTSTALTKKLKIDSAPDVSTEDLGSYRYLPGATTTEIAHNVPYQDLAKPLAGPMNPFSASMTSKNVLTGFVEEHAMSDYHFNTLQRTYQNFGYTMDPNAEADHHIVGSVAKWTAMNGATVNETIKSTAAADSRRKRKKMGDPSQVNGYLGPWAGYETDEIVTTKTLPNPDQQAAIDEALTSAALKADGTPLQPPETKILASEARKKEMEAVAEPGKEKSIFHGTEMFDYLGRSYLHAPTDLGINLLGEAGSKECFIPKRLVHTFTGHTKGVNAIRFFPKTAHLLLSCSMDSKVKLWDVYHERRCLRTFMGHSKAVKSIDFSNDGRRFLTCSYDKWIKLWDTETGQCIKSFTTRRIPNCIKFHPSNDKQNLFLTGCADKKVYQFDVNSGDIVQEYDQHLGAVNTITFVDENRRFVTTSDDKTLRAWEFDIPVVIKYIAEPDMHSMPAVTLHPSHKYMACQSLDNQILIYSTQDRFRLQRKKLFRGHLIAGYACQPGFSADGRFLMSGDSEGKLWFWDWKSCKMLKKLKCHDGVVMDCQWHPHEPSKVATASWDGTIKYWD
ncbi:hypothetical protein HDU76_005588 [Blyttiomyces sp. JEL0837]|nr:hypothetical protein HDU76_005588 [Blyttiomyces sp. JEL0837]